MTTPSRVRVDLAAGGYDVLVGRGFLSDLGPALDGVGGSCRVHVFEDAGVPKAMRDDVFGSLGSRATRSEYRLDESTKSTATLERMLLDLAQAQIERTDLVVALGGGILGDVAGLAAGLHRRGVRVAQCPTTLLAMVDASVGGKTGINLRATIGGVGVLLKNAVGMFHQPVIVMADVGALESLPARDLRSGLAECVKHAVISGEGGQGFLNLQTLIDAMPRLLTGSDDDFVELVRASVALKAGVVAGDERETARGSDPGRRALNLGHTFAHAIEACDWTRVRVEGGTAHPTHGEAVGLGLIAAARLAETATGAGSRLRVTIEAALRAAGLPTRLEADVDFGELTSTMRQDKKASGGRLNLVVPTPAGVAMLDDPGDASLAEAWSAIA